MSKDNSKKVVFFDIDGTLLNHKMELPQLTKDAITTLQENGIYVAIATGRASFMFSELREELGIESFISSNGSYVVVEGEVINKTPLDIDQLIHLEKAADQSRHSMVFIDQEGIVANRGDDQFIAKSLGELGLPYPPVDNYVDRNIYQALLFCEEHEEEYLDSHRYFDYIRWHRYAIDILPSGGSKARGIELMLNHLQANVDNAYVFGDGLNDIEMLAYVGTGVAMGNGREEAKKVADHVTNHVDEDGIYYGLQHVGLL